MNIDTKYYRCVAETQHDPVILKAELIDLITEVETEFAKAHPECLCKTPSRQWGSGFCLNCNKELQV